MKWVVYILLSETGLLYTGMSNDVLKRLQRHNTNRGAKYTKGRGPWKLAYVEITHSRSDALKREYQIKQMSRAAKLKLVQLCNITPLLAAVRDA